MDTRGGEYPVGVRFAKLQDFFTGLQAHTRLNGIRDICIQQFFKQLLPISLFEGISIFTVSQISKRLLVRTAVVMGMGIDDHGYSLLAYMIISY